MSDYEEVLRAAKSQIAKKESEAAEKAAAKARQDAEFLDRALRALQRVKDHAEQARLAFARENVLLEVTENSSGSAEYNRMPYVVVHFYRAGPRASDGYRYQSHGAVFGSDGNRLFAKLDEHLVANHQTFSNSTSVTLDGADDLIRKTLQDAVIKHFEARTYWHLTDNR